jgi:hypothetical protein
MFRFERRLRRRNSQIARLGRQGPSPATSSGSPCVGGRLRKGGGAPLRARYPGSLSPSAGATTSKALTTPESIAK